MSETKIPGFVTLDGPFLAVVGLKSGGGDDFSNAGGSLCLGWREVKTEYACFSLWSWTKQHEITKVAVSTRPAICNGNGTTIAVWKNNSGSGMSYTMFDSESPYSVVTPSSVPHHAHTDSSPSLVVGELGYTLIWKGDHSDGGDGSSAKLWAMSYRVDTGWQNPVQVGGASPAGSPAAALGSPDVHDGWLSTYVAWADSGGQIWWSMWKGTAAHSGSWTTPTEGPVAFTVVSPAIAYFNGSLVIAWTLQACGWIMVSTLVVGSSGAEWSIPARIPSVLTRNGPTMAVWNGKLYIAWRGFNDDSIYYEVFGTLADLPQPKATQSYLVPINNILVGGPYTGSILVGSHHDQANVIIDTGSSTLAVLPSKYHASSDTALVKTSLAQEVQYGATGQTGWWFGPVVETKLKILAATGPALKIEQSTTSVGVAVGASAPPGPQAVFRNADGIMGLAYSKLDNGFDLSAYLTHHGDNSQTFPWVLDAGSTPADQTAFNAVVASSDVTREDVDPVFTQLAQQGLLANKFALWTHRALTSFVTSNPSTDPRNNGLLVLGGGEDQTDLYLGSFHTAEVLDDKFYYVNLISIQVGNQPEISVNSSTPSAGLPSNALVDSGTPQLVLQYSTYQSVVASFQAINSTYPGLMNSSLLGFGAVVAKGSLGLANWPSLTLKFSGPGGSTVKLRCDPPLYWQTDNPQAGFATCTLAGLPSGSTSANIIGLTVLNQYYTVFDRSAGGNGTIKFAEKILYY